MSFASALLVAAWLHQAPPPVPGPSVPATFYVRNMTRVESWRFFEPAGPDVQPDYTFLANRLQFGVTHTAPRWEFVAAGQYVQFANLPERAFGPGPLGSGGAYYDASRDTASRQLYLKYLHAKLKGLRRGLDVQVGRFGYTSGAESFSGAPGVEAVKRLRVDSRMIGEFEWSLYQRSFDGIRADWRNRAYHLTGAWFRPTQGGFEEDAHVHVPDVNVEVLALTTRPGVWIPRTEAQAFFYRYDDSRDIRARPDNTGRAGSSIDVGISTFGATLVSVASSGADAVDGVLWLAAQAGDWYGEPHRAWAVAGEGGYHWQTAPWKPWLRAGINVSSGDNDPEDSSHGTFFQMLPTARKYSLSTVYTQMNLRDAFVQVLAKPTPRIGLRADVHRLTLANAADRWYLGSGVTQKTGTSFGYATRTSGGSAALGTVLEASVDYVLSRHWSVNVYAGRMWGGAVVRSLFTSDTLSFAYLESVIQF